MAWLRQQDWFNGALGTIGASYLGYTAWALAAGPPPELRAIVSRSAPSIPHGFHLPGRRLRPAERSLSGAVGTLFAHRGAAIAASRAMLRLPSRHRRVTTALPLLDAYPAAVGGLSELFERLAHEPGPGQPVLERRGPDGRNRGTGSPRQPGHGLGRRPVDQTIGHTAGCREAGADVRLIVGPWNHTSIFDKGYPVVFPRALEEFAHPPVRPARLPAGQPVRVHVGGSGSVARPDRTGRHHRPAANLWYLGPDGSLGDQLPAQAGSSSFRYDPADPTPSVAGPVLSGTAGSVDNARLEARPDVLTFTSAPLTDALEIPGPVSARLRIRASNPYHDVFARLCECLPARALTQHLRRPDPPSARHRPAGEDHHHRPDELHRLPVQRRAPDQAPDLRRRAPPLRTQHRNSRPAGHRHPARPRRHPDPPPRRCALRTLAARAGLAHSGEINSMSGINARRPIRKMRQGAPG